MKKEVKRISLWFSFFRIYRAKLYEKIVLLFAGLWSWLFPSSTLNLGILFPFPVTVSAIVTPEQKNFFNVDLYKPQESSQEFLENFGPGTFSSSEDAASDEANDAQLYLDMVQSIQIWQRNKQMVMTILDARWRFILQFLLS